MLRGLSRYLLCCFFLRIIDSKRGVTLGHRPFLRPLSYTTSGAAVGEFLIFFLFFSFLRPPWLVNVIKTQGTCRTVAIEWSESARGFFWVIKYKHSSLLYVHIAGTFVSRFATDRSPILLTVTIGTTWMTSGLAGSGKRGLIRSTTSQRGRKRICRVRFILFPFLSC